MELTTEDRERIEQQSKLIYQDDVRGGFDLTASHQLAFKFGAEYATKYEREQQIKTLNRPGSKYYVSYDPDYKDKVFGVFNKEDLTQQGAQKIAQQLNNLEAERSKLRNKVIEECIEVINKSTLNIDWRQQLSVKLNSLKTK